MIELPFLRREPEAVAEGLDKRGLDKRQAIDDILNLDEQRRHNQAKLDEALAQSNSLSKEIGQLYKSGQSQEAEQKKSETAELKAQINDLQNEQDQIAQSLERQLVELPNVPHQLVKKGTSEADNEVVRSPKYTPKLDDKAAPHWELAEQYKLIDFELGNKITGAGFPVYTGQGAKLQRALINFFLEENAHNGYREYQVPLLVNADSAYGTGQLPDKEGQMYHVSGDDLYAIPTSEVPLTNIFRDSILQEEELPLKLTAYTPCFRREAGSYGKDVRGLNRLHQFDKVELVQLVREEDSYKALDQMVDQVAHLLEKLDLPYRILRLCGGDMGFTAAMTYDFEVWSAAQERWLEVSSVSNFETFQSNRMKIRYRSADKKKKLCHTLNGSALALPRILAALLENHQGPEGIAIPEALQFYYGSKFIQL